MRTRLLNVGVAAAMVGVSGFLSGCGNHKGPDSNGAPAGESKADRKNDSRPRVLETVDLAPGKPISAEDRAKISSMGLKVLDHVSKAQQDIQAKNVDGAKAEVAQAEKLLGILKEVLPTVKVIDHIWVTKTNLSYFNTTEVQQDLVSVMASVDQLYDVLPEGKAKEHAKQAKTVLTKDKEKGAPKAREELEAVEEALDFREVDLSVSYTSRLVDAARDDLNKGKTKEAADALKAVSDGVVYFDTALIDPLDLAVRDIWMGTWDYASKDYKAAKIRLAKAKTALQDVAQGGDKTLQAGAKGLTTKIDAIDVSKAGDKTGPALDALWQDVLKLVSQSPKKDKDKTAAGPADTDRTFIRTADLIDTLEVKLGKVAEDHAASAAVKKFGERAVRDHGQMNKELREITSKKGIALTEQLDPKHQEVLDQLSKLKGAEFDKAYTKDMVSDHEKAIEQFEAEAKGGHDSDVKAWAAKWLPTLREHLQLAQTAVKDAGGK